MDGINRIRNASDPSMDDLQIKVARALAKLVALMSWSSVV